MKPNSQHKASLKALRAAQAEATGAGDTKGADRARVMARILRLHARLERIAQLEERAATDEARALLASERGRREREVAHLKDLLA